MNEDYLWDKTGEADPELERLEQTLGRLRYKRPAEPLPLPATVRRSFRLNLFTTAPALAAAAVLVILVLAGSLWFGLHRSSSTDGQGTVAGSTTPQAAEEQSQPEQSASSPRTPPASARQTTDDVVVKAEPRLATQTSDARRVKLPQRLSARPRQELARLRLSSQRARERCEQIAREGENAKAQLIMALHITSQKLSTIQKKIQTNQEQGPIS
jgi:hypothetical protein